MKTARVLQVKTATATHIVIRNGAGKKLFDMTVEGVSIGVTVASDAEIQAEPAQNGVADEKSLNL